EEAHWVAHYRVVRLLGQGGMGRVYVAEDSHLRRQVALKVMHPPLAADVAARTRFLREAQALAALEHDRVVPIYQVGEWTGLPFLAMPLLKGASLGRVLQVRPVLRVVDVLRIGREIAEGLAAIGAAGLVHRDLKPDNVWLEWREAAQDFALEALPDVA